MATTNRCRRSWRRCCTTSARQSTAACNSMIVKIRPLGRSFSKLALYLSHDPKHAETSERLDWTRTLNCAHDHVPSAVHEMYTTWLDGPALKQAAGVRAGGRRIEKPVKHHSLSW